MDMKKQLTTAEVTQVDTWIRQRGFTFEDVRLEILDHVVCSMEALRKDQPHLSLQQAFNQVHASFGVFGFATMEEAFVKSIEKRIRVQLWHQLVSFFKPSGVLFPLSLVVLLISLDQLAGAYLVLTAPILVASYFMIRRLLLYKEQKSLRNHLAFRTGLWCTYFTLPAAFYLLVWMPKMEDIVGLQLWSLALASILILLEWAQWQVLQAELSKHRQLYSKIGLA